jgi:hypothetical protein
VVPPGRRSHSANPDGITANGSLKVCGLDLQLEGICGAEKRERLQTLPAVRSVHCRIDTAVRPDEVQLHVDATLFYRDIGELTWRQIEAIPVRLAAL